MGGHLNIYNRRIHNEIKFSHLHTRNISTLLTNIHKFLKTPLHLWTRDIPFTQIRYIIKNITDYSYIHILIVLHFNVTYFGFKNLEKKVTVFRIHILNSNITSEQLLMLFSMFHPAFFNSIIDKTPTHALFIQHFISLACWFH